MLAKTGLQIPNAKLNLVAKINMQALTPTLWTWCYWTRNAVHALSGQMMVGQPFQLPKYTKDVLTVPTTRA